MTSTDFYTNIRQVGNNLLYIGYDSNGQRLTKRLAYEPRIFVEDVKGVANENYVSITGKKLLEKDFNSISSCKDFIQTYKDVFELYGSSKFDAQYVARTWRQQEVPYNSKFIRTFFLDIETWSGSPEFPVPHKPQFKITAITVYDSKTNSYRVFAEANSPGGKVKVEQLSSQSNKKIMFTEYDSEEELLVAFLSFWTKNFPDVLSGWYSRTFDLPFIVDRLDFILGEGSSKKLSPWEMVRAVEKKVKKGNNISKVKCYDIFGVNELDYRDLYEKYSQGKKESYALNYIAEEEIGESKHSFDMTLHELYESDYHSYIDYNIQDVGLLVRLEEKLKFLELIIDVAYSGKVPTFVDALGTVKYWEILIDAHLEDKNQAAQMKFMDDEIESESYEGAYVKPPIPGKYNWVINYDFTSLYPSIIRQINIGPETLVPYHLLPDEIKNSSLPSLDIQAMIDNAITDTDLLRKYSLSYSANNKFYRTDSQSFLAELMEKFFNKRVMYKNLLKEAKNEVLDIEAEMRKRGLLT